MLPISQRLCTLQADIKVCPSLEATQVDAIVSPVRGLGDEGDGLVMMEMPRQ